MKIAELFVNLGIKGDEKTQKAIGGVQSGLGKISTAGLEAKAALIAMMYGLQRLTSASTQEATSLQNFSLRTGIATKTLQQYQYAARLAGASSEEFNSSIAALQQNMEAMKQGKGAPEWWGALQSEMGRIDLNDPIKAFQKIQEFTQKFKGNASFIQSGLRAWGIGDNVYAGMLKNVFTEQNFKKAPTYSDGEIQRLDKVRQLWVGISDKIEKSIGILNSKYGGKLVADIERIIPKIMKLVENLALLAEKAKVFDVIGKGIDLMGGGVDKINKSNLFGLNSEKMSDDEKFKRYWFYGTPDSLLNSPGNFLNKMMGNPSNQNITVNQTFNNIDSPAKAGAAANQGMKDAIKPTAATSPARAWGN